MQYIDEYKKWLSSEVVDSETKAELEGIKDNDKEIKERFYKDLEFGTAGLRGVLGAGINRMNVYIVRKATQGLSAFILSQGKEAAEKGVAISYDSRNNSELFAKETACVLVANGIKVYLSDALRPVPELSFAVRHFGAFAGVMITASHNPAKYNGYKVYGSDGGQAPLELSDKVLEVIGKTDIFKDVKTISFEEAVNSGKIEFFGEEFDEVYLENVLKQQINKDAVQKVADDFKIIYTPLHGSGNIPVRKMLSKVGFKKVLLVEEQLIPDGNFPTVKSPNPENKEAFDIAIEMAKANDVDLIIGTDPDCDRVGIVVRDNNGEYIALTGNMTGALLTEYILNGRQKNNNLPKDGAIIKTIVTTYMADVICKAYGVEVMNVLTGFKFIGEKIKEFEEKKNHTYLFGFEESYGYLAGTHARDKDAVVATMLITEMAAWYKEKGMSLYEGLIALYEKYGVFREKAVSIEMEGLDGNEKIAGVMKAIRENAPMQIGGKKVLSASDLLQGIEKNLETKAEEKINLPKANVLLFKMEDDCWCAVRPSGTEPKIKFYIGSKEKTVEEAEKTVEKMWNDLKIFIK